MEKFIYILTICVLFFGCTPNTRESENDLPGERDKPETTTDSLAHLLQMNKGTITVLFSEGDSVVSSSAIKAPAKGHHDCIVLFENSPKDFTLFVSHETVVKDSLLGDGGGGTIVHLQYDNTWKTKSSPFNVDYSEVGFTANNCGGKTTPHQTLLSAEEIMPRSKNDLTINYDYKKLASPDFEPYQNLGWMVEIDPEKRKALHKLISMGRYKHEDALAMPDGKTVYLTNDDDPAIFFKFIADKANDYTKGQLYAYAETASEGNKHWIALPRDTNALMDIAAVAIKMGATLFQRHEWLTFIGGKIYITETGKDTFDWKDEIANGGKPAGYFEQLKHESHQYNDPYGRILVFDPSTDSMQVYLNGGKANDSGYLFSNPDGLTSATIDGQAYLFVCEDITSLDFDKVSAENKSTGTTINEVYRIPVTENCSLNDIDRLLVAPKGAESTGILLSPDKKSLFLNIQHPQKTNNAPFDKSCTIVIENF